MESAQHVWNWRFFSVHPRTGIKRWDGHYFRSAAEATRDEFIRNGWKCGEIVEVLR
jgi:hypothetical protein